jgi:very-short-patch-repair endonuclease
MREKRVKSRDEYIEQLNLINPNIMLIGDYINAHTPTLHRCLIDGYEWMLKPNNALSGKGCPNCYGNIKKNQLEYVEELSLKNPNLEVLEDYINAKTPILHRCKRHNIKWKISPDNALHGYGCKECLREKIGEKNSKTHEQYVKELKEINPNIIVLGEYIDAKTPILHRCLIDGYEWMVRPDNVLCGTGCPKCAGNIKKTHEEYVYELSCINPYIKVIEKYIDSVTPILHECLIDGYQWYAAPTNLLSGCGCPQCHESSGERQIRTWLEKHDVLYDFQKRFSDCKDINSLPFDFYLPDYNIAIEYDGKQHFEPIEYFGGIKSFERTVKHDNIKNEYCKNNGISLLRIPYFKNVEEELNNFLFI